MTGTTLTTDIRRRTKTSSATLPDATLLPVVNAAKDTIVSRITEKDENLFIVPAYKDLVASTIDAREYSLADDQLNNLASIELAFDGTQSPLVYVYARQIPYTTALKQTGGLTESKITNVYNSTVPYYFILRRAIYILSGTISAVTNGIKIRYRAYPTDLANLTGVTALEIDPTTTTFGIPRQFHRLWSMAASIDWKNNRPKPIPLSEEEKGWELEMRDRLAEMKRSNLSEEILGQQPNSQREGNYGYDL